MPARARIIFPVMLAGLFLAASDLTVVSTILPQVVFDLQIPLRTGMSQAAWIVSAYLLAYTVAMPLLGRISDFTGRRNAYLASLAVFAAGSVLAGSARALEPMIGGRALQAIGAGALVPITMAYVADALPPARRPWALGVVGALDTAGWVVGPLYGAAVVSVAHWQWIFFANVPIAVVLAVLLMASMRSERKDEPRPFGWRSLDMPGAVLFSLALLSITLAVSGSQSESGGSLFAGQSGFNAFAYPLLLVGSTALLLFVWQERRTARPFLPLSLFANRSSSAACATNLLIGAALIVAMVNVPLFINIAVAMTLAEGPKLSGFALAGFTLGMVGGSLAGGRLVRRFGHRVPSLAGLIIAAVGFAQMSQWRPGVSLETMAPALIVCGAGMGVVIAPIASAVVNAAEMSDRGIASALVLIMRLVGMAVGLALLTTVGLARLNHLAAALPAISLTDPNAGRLLFEQARMVSVQVLDELFLGAALLCLLACLPVLFISDRLSRSNGSPWFGWR